MSEPLELDQIKQWYILSNAFPSSLDMIVSEARRAYVHSHIKYLENVVHKYIVALTRILKVNTKRYKIVGKLSYWHENGKLLQL